MAQEKRRVSLVVTPELYERIANEAWKERICVNECIIRSMESYLASADMLDKDERRQYGDIVTEQLVRQTCDTQKDRINERQIIMDECYDLVECVTRYVKANSKNPDEAFDYHAFRGWCNAYNKAMVPVVDKYIDFCLLYFSGKESPKSKKVLDLFSVSSVRELSSDCFSSSSEKMNFVAFAEYYRNSEYEYKGRYFRDLINHCLFLYRDYLPFIVNNPAYVYSLIFADDEEDKVCVAG